MTESGATRRRGRPIDAVIGLAWVGLGLWYLEGGSKGFAAAFVVLGLLHGSTYLWPHALADRFPTAPVLRRKRPTDR